MWLGAVTPAEETEQGWRRETWDGVTTQPVRAGANALCKLSHLILPSIPDGPYGQEAQPKRAKVTESKSSQTDGRDHPQTLPWLLWWGHRFSHSVHL